jgi:hypothetical protein
LALPLALAFAAAAAGLVADCAEATDGDSIVFTATAAPTMSDSSRRQRVKMSRVGTEA